VVAVVLITGCSSGFGLLTALAFARDGDTVYATMRNLSRSTELERAAAAEGLPLECLELDVTSDRSVLAAVDHIVDAQGRIDVCVNNAGVELRGAVHLCSDEEIRWQFETNVFGLLRVTRAVVPVMKRGGGGVIVNVGAVAGLVTPPYDGVYAASKHAVEALTEAMHLELAPWGIRVSVVEPGRFRTSLEENARLAERQTPDTVEHERAERFRGALDRLAGEGERPGPELVARAIVSAARGTPRRLRHLVGFDTELVLEVRRGADFEGYEEQLRRALDWWD
jgi:NAD(P)-dependent dehydrogenase (short-subunit alcohol dehydrogenase family)